MDFSNFSFFGFPADFGSFTSFLNFMSNQALSLVVLVWFMNWFFCALKELVLTLGGVRNGKY